MTLLRAMSPKYSSDEAILQAFYETEDDRHRRPQGRRQARGPDRLRRRRRPEHRRGPDRERRDDLQDLGADPGRRRNLGADHGPQGRQGPADPPVAPGRPDHRPRERPAADLPAAPAGQPAAAGEGQASCSTRSSSTPTATAWARSAGSGSTASSTRTIPEDQMTLRPDRLRQRDPLHPQPPQGQGARRRHRPPGQPPAPDHRRAGRRRAAQGLPQAPPHRAGADEPEGRRGHDPAVADQPQEHLARRSSTSSAAASCRRSSTRPTRWRSSRTSGGSRPWARAA